MASEIRVNKIENRSGLGTVTFADTGVDLAGISTAATLKVTTGIVTTLTVGTIKGAVTPISDNGTIVGIADTIDFGSGLNVSAVSAGVATVTTSFVTPEKFGAIAKPVIEAETRTWYNAMSTKPKREHLRSMDMLVKRLKVVWYLD